MNFINLLNKEENRHYDIRRGVSTIVLGLLARARGLDLLLPEEQVSQHTDFDPRTQSVYHIIGELHYPIAGFPPARAS